jgi:hypothetical protein
MLWFVCCHRCHGHPLVVAEPARPRRAWLILQPGKSFSQEPAPPHTDLMLVHVDPVGDLS